MKRTYFNEWGLKYAETWEQDEDGTSTERREFVYNLYGDLVQELVYASAGASPSQIGPFGYDYRGLRVSELWTEPATESVLREEAYTYDAAGNVLSSATDFGPEPDGTNDRTTSYDYSCW